MRARTFCSLARWFTLLGCCLAATFSCFANCESASEHYVDLALRDSPTSIQTLAKEIRDKSDNEIEAIVTKRFGVGLDVGSGLRILQWDVESGVLTIGRGLTFFRPTGGKALWLTATSSKALQTVTKDRFEMTTLPSPQMKYWLGDLELKTGLSYNFIDSREWESLQHRGKQKRNFFLSTTTADLRFNSHRDARLIPSWNVCRTRRFYLQPNVFSGGWQSRRHIRHHRLPQ